MLAYDYGNNDFQRRREAEKQLPEPASVDEAGIPPRMIGDLCLKLIYQYSIFSARRIAEFTKLPYYGVIDPTLVGLRKAELIEVGGSEGLGEMAYQYVLTPKGQERVRDVIDQSTYVGPAPVPLEHYRRMIKAQTIGDVRVGPAQVREALSDMVLGNDIIEAMGPAVNTGRSMFLYGPPGNGKTLLSEHVAKLLGGDIYLPYAVEADGYVIKVYDQNLHVLSNEGKTSYDPLTTGYDNMSTEKRLDGRWVLCKRPVIIVGGELTLANLDLIYDENAKFYEAPFQMKSNNGMFLIDDFGRQSMRPRDLLNRWIVPLEKRYDFLTLRNGKKIEIPFDELIVFSTNLAPRDLVDEAFLRRIQNKIEVRSPTFEEYREILRRNCEWLNVQFSDEGAVYLLREHYIKAKRELRSCQPRDLLKQIIGISAYQGVPPTLSKELVDQAIATYFVEL